MKPISKRLIKLITIFLVAPAFIIASHQLVFGANLDQFKNGCVKGCTKSPSHRDYCNRHCDCIVSNLPRSGDSEKSKKTNLSKSEMQKLNFVCSGEVGTEIMLEKCNGNCKSDQTCLKICACLSAKIKENRTPEQVGKFLNSLASNSAAMQQLQSSCARP